MRAYVWTRGATPPEMRIMRRLLADHGPLHPDACWIWRGSFRGRDGDQYGAIMTGSRTTGRQVRSTHVVMWEAENGPTPEGLELHHRCQVKLCCNPRHLSPVTHAETGRLVPEQVNETRRKNLALARAVKSQM